MRKKLVNIKRVDQYLLLLFDGKEFLHLYKIIFTKVVSI